MVYYKLKKIMINAPGFTKLIINFIIKDHSLPNFMITD